MQEKNTCKKKKKKSVYQKISTDEPNTYSFFLQFQDCVGWRQKALAWGNKKRESVGLQDRPSS